MTHKEKTDQQERLRNLLVYKMYLTDEERKNISPWFLVFLLCVAAILVLIGEALK